MKTLKQTASAWLAPLVLVLAIKSSLADQYVIPSGSMEPTIQIGDHVWVNKAAYDLRLPFTDLSLLKINDPRRGEVLVFKDPRNPSIRLIKRVVGLPGDEVRISRERISINGEVLRTTLSPQEIARRLDSQDPSFTYLESGVGLAPHQVKRLPGFERPEERTFRVPEESYFFLGDNRDNSADSRDWGFASRQAIQGRAHRIIYSVHWNGLVPRPAFDRSGLDLGDGG